jgi:GntR family transcriptional regulator of arabinose operon
MAEKERSTNKNFKYVKLYEWVTACIYNGEMRYGDKLPSEAMLCNRFKVSRQSVRTAMDFLESGGFVRREQGSGTYIAYDMLGKGENQKTVGLLISYFTKYLFPHVFSGIESELSKANIGIDIAVTYNRINIETAFLDRMLHSNVSGIIIEGTKSAFPSQNINLYNALQQRGIPIIFFHNHYSNLSFSSVEMSDEQCIFLLTKKLIDSGHKHIAGIFKFDDLQGVERYKGFLRCMAGSRLKIDDECIKWYSTEDYENSFSRRSLTAFMKKISGCTAIIVFNDEVAVEMLSFFETKGIRVPEDISMVSIDDTDLARSMSYVHLVSAVHPKDELGRMVAGNMVKMISDKDWRTNDYSYRFPARINDGDSVMDISSKNTTK